MWNNKLLYTGVTRARIKVEIFGERKQFISACKTADEVRQTVIGEGYFTKKSEVHS